MAGKRYNYILRHDGASGGNGSQSAAAQAQNPKRRRVRKKEPGLRIYDGPLDMLFFAIVIVLLAYGIIMMFSASYIAGLNLNEPDGYHYVRTQGQAAVIGVVMMIFISFFDYHILMNSKIAVTILLAAAALMLAVFSPIGYEEHGARRWIMIGSMSFQPSEFMKVAVILFLSYFIVKNEQNLGSFKKGVLPLFIFLGIIAGSMVLQRHISGLLLMSVIGLCVLFIGGMPWKRFIQLCVLLLGAAVIFALIYSAMKGGGLNYIADRISSMSDAESGEITDDSWQTSQSLIAIGSGGWFGLGFGESKQKYLWLPESQNDFIISIIVEELGYLGGLVVIILFGLLIYRGFYIAKKAPDKFGMLITAGITFQIGVQALLNIGVACNAFPNTGVALPFFSSGGTALLIQLAEMGIILGVSRQCEI